MSSVKKTAAATIGVAMVATLAWIAGPARAVPGGVQDPPGDAGGFKTDIRAVYHNDNPTTGDITYYVQTWGNFDNAGWVGDFEWDHNEDGIRDGGIQFSLEFGATVITYTASGIELGRRTTVRRAPVAAVHGATGSTASNTVEVIVNRSDLQLVGQPTTDDGYNYGAAMGSPDNSALGDETAPELGTRHVFSTGTGPSPSPSSSPSPSPSPGPGTAPETSITDGPGNKTRDRTPTFRFTSTVAGATFECSVDLSAFRPCTSPFTTEALRRKRRHSFEVISIAPDGAEDLTPAEETFKVTKKRRRR